MTSSMLYQFFLKGDTDNSFKNEISFSLMYYSQSVLYYFFAQTVNQEDNALTTRVVSSQLILFFIVLVKLLSKGLDHLWRKLLYNVIYSGYEYELRIQIHLPLNPTSAT